MAAPVTVSQLIIAVLAIIGIVAVIQYVIDYYHRKHVETVIRKYAYDPSPLIRALGAS